MFKQTEEIIKSKKPNEENGTNIYTLWEPQKEKIERGRKITWKNNDQNLPEFDERHESRNPKCSANSK